MASTIGLPSYFGQLLATADVPDLCWKQPLLMVVFGSVAGEVAEQLAAVHPLALLRVADSATARAAKRVAMQLLREQKSVLLTGILPSEKLLRLARQNRGGFQAVYVLSAAEQPPRRLVGKRPLCLRPQKANLRHLLQPLHQELRQRLGNEAWWANRYDRLLY